MMIHRVRRILAMHRPFCRLIHYHPGDITRQNFRRSLDAFKSHLHSADFVAIDLELSGVQNVQCPEFSADSSAVDRFYCRIKHLAEKFAVFQVGVALFQWDKACNKFVAYPYNFYVFPRNELSLELHASTFSCAASSLEFLASHGFDFNLCFQDGISYLSKTQEAAARAQMVHNCSPVQVKQFNFATTLSSTSDLIFFEKLRVELGKWCKKLENCSLNWHSLGDNELHMIKTFGGISRTDSVDGFQVEASTVPHTGKFSVSESFKQHPSLTLQLENQHQVHLAHLVLDKHFQELIPIISGDSVSEKKYEITIMFARSRQESVFLKNGLEQGSTPSKEALINDAIGFRHVIDAIATSRKPLVGHNCALDLAHIYNKFISPLPASVAEFSSSLMIHFPTIIDTKYLIKFEQNLRASWARRHTSLGAVYSHLCKPKDIKVGAARFARNISRLSQNVEIDIMVGFKRYQDTDVKQLHEAGYDAFMTGSIFAQICHLLHVDVKNLQSLSLGNAGASAIAEHINVLNFGHVVMDLRAGKEKDVCAGTSKAHQTSSTSVKENLELSYCAEV